MGEPARQLDMIDVTPAFTRADAQAMQARFEGVSAQDMLCELLAGELRGRIAAVSSFGAESAVLLHMVAQVDVDVPVVFTNTQKMFGETLRRSLERYNYHYQKAADASVPVWKRHHG